ncbi:hypothetical protein LguiA_028545 [Lonicera macranthoides]
MDLHEEAVVRNLQTVSSNHSALLLQTESTVYNIVYHFRFENSWVLEPDYRFMVATFWGNNSDLNLIDCVQCSGKGLEGWGNDIIMKFKCRLRCCRAEMDSLVGIRDDAATTRLLELRNDLYTLLDQQESY